MKKMKKLALLVACLLLGTLVLTACSASPVGTWRMTGVKNDQTGEMDDLLTLVEALDTSIEAEITGSRVTISIVGIEDLMTFNYRQSGNKLVDTADDSTVQFRVSDDTLTLIFEDCDMIFTRVK